MDWMPQAIREGIFTIIFISGPLVVLAAVLGLSVGIVQAATQIQEQTLASAVKIIGLFIALIVFGFYMFQYLQQYTNQNLTKAFKLVPNLGHYVKPRNNFLTRTEEDSTRTPGVPIPDLDEIETGESSMGKLADELNEPDVQNINVNKKPDRIGMPKGQIKEVNDDIKKIDEENFNSSVKNNTNDNIINEPVVRPVPRNPNPSRSFPAERQEDITPKPLPKKSLTGALDRIRSSLEEN